MASDHRNSSTTGRFQTIRNRASPPPSWAEKYDRLVAAWLSFPPYEPPDKNAFRRVYRFLEPDSFLRAHVIGQDVRVRVAAAKLMDDSKKWFANTTKAREIDNFFVVMANSLYDRASDEDLRKLFMRSRSGQHKRPTLAEFREFTLQRLEFWGSYGDEAWPKRYLRGRE